MEKRENGIQVLMAVAQTGYTAKVQLYNIE